MHEIEQKILDMTLDEFKVWEVPKGWKMMYLSGEEKLGWPGSLDCYFRMRVVLIKENDNAIL